jgi:YfiH family protein
MWIFAPNIHTRHGFSTRQGGISPAPFSSLNLGGSDDDKNNINENRRLALEQLNVSDKELSLLKQVHGSAVRLAANGYQEGDALVTNDPKFVLAVSIADCYPILFHDPVSKVIGAAHAGWRGTLGRIASNTLKEMIVLGADAKNIQVAIGQGICQKNFEVGEEVIEQFRSAAFPEACWNGRYLDLIGCNTFVLKEAGVPSQNIWSMNRCTFEPEFFSYRRDKGQTGRMWGCMAL